MKEVEEDKNKEEEEDDDAPRLSLGTPHSLSISSIRIAFDSCTKHRDSKLF